MFAKKAAASIIAGVLISGVAYGVSSHRTVSVAYRQQSSQILHQQRDELVARIEHGKSELKRATGLTAAKPAEIQQMLTSLEGAREMVELELLSKQARSAELQKQIKKYQDELAERGKNDPVALQLAKVIAPFEEDCERKKSNPQAYAPTEIARAEADVAAQQVQLLERRDLFGPDAPLLNQLRHDQIDLATDIAELQTRYNLLTDRRNVLRSVERYIGHAEEWQNKLEEIDKQIGGDDAESLQVGA